MVNFIFSPSWFYGIDSIFEAVTLLVAVLISIFSYKIYRFNNLKRYYWFSVSFLMLAVSFLAKIVTNVTVYFNILEKNSFGIADKAYAIASGSEGLFMYGFATYRLLTLLAFLGIYLVMTTKVKTSKSAVFLFTYFVFALMYFSKKVALAFHFTTALLIFFIFMFTFRNCYRKTNTKTTCVAMSFLILLISQLLFIPAYYGSNLAYVAAEVVQLLGYSTMLATYIMIRKSIR